MKTISDNRGQAYTLEGVASSILLLATISFAIQSTAVTPLSTSTSNEQIELQNSVYANDILEVTADDGRLSEAIRYYNTSSGRFHNESRASRGYIRPSPNETGFHSILSKTLATRGVAYNVVIRYQVDANQTLDDMSATDSRRWMYQGQPSNNAVTATKTVVLYDDQKITSPESNMTLKESDKFYMNDSSTSEVYNVVQVEVTVWEI